MTVVAATEQAVALGSPAATRYRIAVFSYGLPVAGEKRGGIERVAHDLSNALADRGHAVTVFTYDPRPSDARYQVSCLPLRRFVMSWLGRRVTMGYLGNLLATFPNYRDFDFIMAHGDSLLLPLKSTPVIRVMHGSARDEARTATSVGRKLLQYGVFVQELLTARLQRGTVGVSENTRASNPFVTQTIPNGVDLRLFRPDPATKSRAPRILFVGALGGRKRGDWLIDQFEQKIRPAMPDVELHMVTSAGRPVPGVVYHTGISNADLIRLYQSAWVYASPSTYEGFGLPYVEAMACGTPVVATANAGSVEVTANGRYGCLPDDTEFATEVTRLLKDSAWRGELGALGQVRAREFDLDLTVARYETLMSEMLNG